ncbi:MAG: 23S rRNA (adenine(2503)-C(2))-methyltransferase RlmN [Cyanobacteria bacterium SBLK]|nr:23S rRNA (adenine(2503)-C(2))-methyltransferase RlmN [Cyanobacteria bacterium SBLK]
MNAPVTEKPKPDDALLGRSLEQLTEWVRSQGQPPYRGKQLHQWLYQKGARSLSDITVFPKQWRSEVETVKVGRSRVHHRSIAPDQTRKYLLRLEDDALVETVGIPTEKRLTVCVSSQVGCPMNCDFCATGKGGFLRNLKAWEIVDQVLTVQEDFQRRVSNVVFMGMGEPLLNLDEVVASVRTLNEDVGIAQRSLVISTVGIPHRIRQLAEHNLQVTFAVSLHAPEQKLRAQLIPGAKHYPLEKLLSDCRKYVNMTGRRVTFEYILLAGVNDSPKQAIALAKLIQGMQSHVNLIPYNPISEADYQRPKTHDIQQFKHALEQYKIAVSVRYSRGLETDAACGQLRINQSVIISPSPVLS